MNLKCVKCGSDNVYTKKGFYADMSYWKIGCRDCGFEIESRTSESDALDMWRLARDGIRIKTCPFCGGDAELHNLDRGYSIVCHNCFLEVRDAFAPASTSKESLVGSYNKRV